MQDSDDIGDLPTFLVRKPGDTKPVAKPKPVWKISPAAQKANDRSAIKAAVQAANPLVVEAVRDGADTTGKIRSATSLSDNILFRAMRYNLRRRFITRVGRRYYVTR